MELNGWANDIKCSVFCDILVDKTLYGWNDCGNDLFNPFVLYNIHLCGRGGMKPTSHGCKIQKGLE